MSSEGFLNGKSTGLVVERLSKEQKFYVRRIFTGKEELLGVYGG
jgi:hypothetical protein